VGGGSPDDSTVTFANENITGVLQVPKDPQGGLLKSDLQIQIYCAESEVTPYVNIKNIAINLALFVDNGKVQDLIPFTDMGLSFAFQMEVVQVFSQELVQQQMNMSQVPMQRAVTMPVASQGVNQVRGSMIGSQASSVGAQGQVPNPYLQQ
jgi:hypothetical protein